MAHHPLVVVGSGPAGIAAARAYLDAGGDGPATLFTADVDLPYQRPPLSKEMLRDTTSAPHVVPILDDEQGLSGVDVLLGRPVAHVDPLHHTVTVGDDEHTYDRLVLAPGAHPTPLPVADDDAQVLYLRSLRDARALSTAAAHARTAVVIGSGFIGCEAAASLAMRGIETTLVTSEHGPQAARLGAHASEVITGWLTELGVRLVTDATVTGVHAPRTVHTDDGRTHAADLVLAAIGVTPSTDFLQDSGFAMYDGRIVVDERLRTTMRDVWAAGDAVHAHHARAGRTLSVEHWGDASTMGEIAGGGAAGHDAEWSDPPGFWSEIGAHQLKYSAWGDGWDDVSVTERTGGFTMRYGRDGQLAGVLTYGADDDYEAAADQLGRARFSSAGSGDDQ
ncbi:NAD(P)/FAD-dependent oxidoreductase [Allobranchiibius huperziae]|uniref:NADPH-dependent 2,4-dienoyl-CoA reductase/sulfur reductase-like enzyme n=1 Tax=Allobranchiibius huperziae TaxID=1874116 RepID=A0A853DI48_9MICO|nr:NAD(P)/FAD-dependent oxidoreductase [Allobranchiibius huperziae]NYJ76438.1 NADPH-dependent 2,4-dienoyl-CoA reductase/sulfur reductase-like enzyme [Allobranchiibius huperziae]